MAVSGLASSFIGASSANFTPGRERGITRITIHHMAGVMSSNDCGRVFQNPETSASAHYGIGVNGDIAAYVDESNTAWSDGYWDSNAQTISIETSNSSKFGDWPVSDASYNALIDLVADIATRNGLGNLQVGVNLFKHQDFVATTCPGPYLAARMQDIADRANAKMNGLTPPAPSPSPTPSDGKSIDQLAQEVIAGFWGNGAERERNLANAGYDYNAVQAKVNELIYGGNVGGGTGTNADAVTAVAQAVIRGDYGNGADRERNLAAAGWDYNTVQAKVNELLGLGSSAPATPAPSAGIGVGSVVTLTNWVDYNGTPLAQTRPSYVVSELLGDRAVLTADGAVYAAVNVNNLRRI